MTTAFNPIIALVPFFGEVLAQADTESLAKYGLLGIVLGYFMFRQEKHQEKQELRQQRVEHKLEGLNKTMLIDIMSRPTSSEKARQLCRHELHKLDPDMASEFGE